MTFYTPLERLAKSAKEQGMAVAADPETVLRLCKIARAAIRANSVTTSEQRLALLDRLTDFAWAQATRWEAAEMRAALRAALGTQPVKETNDV